MADMQVTVRLGGERVWILVYFPVRKSSATISRMKSDGAGDVVSSGDVLITDTPTLTDECRGVQLLAP